MGCFIEMRKRMVLKGIKIRVRCGVKGRGRIGMEASTD